MSRDVSDAVMHAASDATNSLAVKGFAVNATGGATLAVSSNAQHLHWWTSDIAAWVGMLVGAFGVICGVTMQYRAHRMRVKEHTARMKLLDTGLDSRTLPGELR